MIDASGKDIRLEIDGGVKADNIGEIAARADTFVAGSAIFNARTSYQDVIAQMRANVAAARAEP